MTTSFALCCGCYTCFNYSKGGSHAKALLFHQLCWWFFLALGAQKETIATQADDEGMVATALVRVPGEGFIFGLYNSDEILYADDPIP